MKARVSFTNSLGELLSNHFCFCPSFSVVSYFSLIQKTTKVKNLKTIISHYGVQYVITGSVQFELRKFRITAQLVEAVSEIQVWSKVYDFNGEEENFLQLADRIVMTIMEDLENVNNEFGRNFNSHTQTKKMNLMDKKRSYALSKTA